MRDPLKDKGRLQHILEMAILLESEKANYSLEIHNFYVYLHKTSKACAI